MFSLDNIKKYFPCFYGVILVLSIFYVSKIVNDESLSVDKYDRSKEKVLETHEIDVEISIDSGKKTLFFSKKLLTPLNVGNVLEILRKEEQLKYEITMYVDTIKVTEIDDIKDTEKFNWNIYVNDNKLYGDITKYELNDKDAVLIKYERII